MRARRPDLAGSRLEVGDKARDEPEQFEKGFRSHCEELSGVCRAVSVKDSLLAGSNSGTQLFEFRGEDFGPLLVAVASSPE